MELFGSVSAMGCIASYQEQYLEPCAFSVQELLLESVLVLQGPGTIIINIYTLSSYCSRCGGLSARAGTLWAEKVFSFSSFSFLKTLVHDEDRKVTDEHQPKILKHSHMFLSHLKISLD